MKTICIYHSRDLDGWMSAAIVKLWFEKNHTNKIMIDVAKNKIIEQERIDIINEKHENYLYMLGWDYGDEIPDLSEYDKVIICDISLPPEVMYNISHSKKVIWIDHHASAIKDMKTMWDEKELVPLDGMRDEKFAACELTWKFLFPKETMPEIVRFLGRYDCFGHKGTDEEQSVLYLQYAARASISDYNEAYTYLLRDINESILTGRMMEPGKEIYHYLCSEAKQTYSKAFPIHFDNPNLIGYPENGGEGYKFLCVNQERFNPINFGIDYHKEGYDGFACFWYKNGQWTWSLYNDNKEVDCSAICKGYGGGGHQGAAGFVIDDIKDLFDNRVEADKMEDAMISFNLKGDLNDFEKEYLPKLAKVNTADEFQRRHLLGVIWIRLNEEWTNGRNKD